MSAVSNGLLPFTSADDPFVCFTGALAAVLLVHIGSPDTAEPYGYMQRFSVCPAVPRGPSLIPVDLCDSPFRALHWSLRYGAHSSHWLTGQR